MGNPLETSGILCPLLFQVFNYTGEVVAPDLNSSDNKISGAQMAVGVIGIIAVLSLAYFAIKD